MAREYRIPGARFSLLDGLLLVQYRSGTGVKLGLGEGTPQDYQAAGPVWFDIDDGTGAQPVVDGQYGSESDDFGVVLTELAFRGDVKAEIVGNELVVTASGEPKILLGGGCLPVTQGDISGAARISWGSSSGDGNPHQPT